MPQIRPKRHGIWKRRCGSSGAGGPFKYDARQKQTNLQRECQLCILMSPHVLIEPSFLLPYTGLLVALHAARPMDPTAVHDIFEKGTLSLPPLTFIDNQSLTPYSFQFLPRQLIMRRPLAVVGANSLVLLYWHWLAALSLVTVQHFSYI
jgi:hypothetical protein